MERQAKAVEVRRAIRNTPKTAREMECRKELYNTDSRGFCCHDKLQSIFLCRGSTLGVLVQNATSRLHAILPNATSILLITSTRLNATQIILLITST
jgi:hypothetical protein